MNIKDLRLKSRMTQKEFAEYFGIPRRTIEDWDSGKRTPPAYVVELIKYKLEKESVKMFKIDKRKKIETIDVVQNKDYQDVDEALVDLGFNNIGDCDIIYKGETIRKNVYKKDGKYYYFVGMENYNTTIYNVSIRELIEG